MTEKNENKKGGNFYSEELALFFFLFMMSAGSGRWLDDVTFFLIRQVPPKHGNVQGSYILESLGRPGP